MIIFENKQKEIEAICMPIMTKMYGASDNMQPSESHSSKSSADDLD